MLQELEKLQVFTRCWTTGDPELTRKLVINAHKLCFTACKTRGEFAWEWPGRTDLWNMLEVQDLRNHARHAERGIISSAALGLTIKQGSCDDTKYYT